MKMKSCDVAIIGAGPAGITAGIYALRYNLSTLVIGKIAGGWLPEITVIDNWPGEPKGVSGLELARRFKEHLLNMNPKFITEMVTKVTESKDLFVIETETGKRFQAKSLIIATGSKKRQLNVPGEKEFLGKGVSYCVTCDGPLFRDRRVAVVGGGDSAVMAALMLAEYAKEIHIIVRDNEFIAKPYRVELLKKYNKVRFHFDTTVKEIFGKKFLEGVVLNNGNKLTIDGLFVEIGVIPANKLAKQLGLELDKTGRIVVKDDMSSSKPKVFAAGDVTNGSNNFAQIVTAAAEGAIAANSVYKVLK